METLEVADVDITSAAERVLQCEDLCEALCDAVCSLADAAALASAAPRGSPFRAIAHANAHALHSRGPMDWRPLVLTAPCAVGASIHAGGEYKLCAHGLCRAQPCTPRPGVAPLLQLAAASTAEGSAAPCSQRGHALLQLAQCRDACHLPSADAWHRAALAGNTIAQVCGCSDGFNVSATLARAR